MTIDDHCRMLSRFYFVAGMDADDIYQEARLAAWLAPAGLERMAARRQVYDLMKIGQRRRFDALGERDVASHVDVVDIVDARERLRAIMAMPWTPLQRRALGRRIRGEGNTEKQLDNAWFAVRRKLAA